MSLFDSLASIIPAVASVAGEVIGSSANSKATKAQNKALEQANALRQEGIDKATGIYGDLQTASAPAVNYLRDVVANPVGGLYPDQLEAQQDERRNALNDVSSSGLRGSGRAVTASLKKVDSDFVNTAMAQNRNNRMNAAGQLTGQYFTAGDNTASALASGANEAANTTEQQGTNTANLGTTNANMLGNTLGDIGSLIAQETKGRDSRYAGLDVPLRPADNTDGTEKLSHGGVVRRSRLHEVRAA